MNWIRLLLRPMVLYSALRLAAYVMQVIQDRRVDARERNLLNMRFWEFVDTLRAGKR